MYKIIFFIGIVLTLIALLRVAVWFAPTANSSYNQGFLTGNIILCVIGIATAVTVRKKAFKK